MLDFEKLRYPIGKYKAPEPISMSQIQQWMGDIARLPEDLAASVEGLNDSQLSVAYRPGGWNLRQVVHHVADSHINSFVRYHWTLTEDQPRIKAYDQDAWVNLPDGVNGPVSLSLDLLTALHKRWIFLMERMTEADYRKKLIHPETGNEIGLDFMTGLYAWHGKHHTAQITGLRERMEW